MEGPRREGRSREATTRAGVRPATPPLEELGEGTPNPNATTDPSEGK